MPDLVSSFEQLLGRRASQQEIDSLQRVKKTLGLADNDALWVVLIALEYYDVLYRQYPAQIASQMEKVLQRQQATLAAMVDAECGRGAAGLAALGGIPAPGGLARAQWALCAAWTVFALILFGAFCACVGYLLGSGHPPPWADAVQGPGLPLLLSVLARTPAGWIAPAVAGFCGLTIWAGGTTHGGAPLTRRQRRWLALGWAALAALMLLVALPLP